MRVSKIILSLFLVLLLLPGLVAPEGLMEEIKGAKDIAGQLKSSQGDQFQESRIYVETNPKTNEIDAALMVFTTTSKKPVFSEVEYRKMISDCNDPVKRAQVSPLSSNEKDPVKHCQIVLSQKRAKEQGYSTELKTIDKVKFTFQYTSTARAEYSNPWQPVSSCGSNGVVTANKVKQIASSDEKAKPLTYYYATCKIDPSLYKTKRITVRVIMDPTENPTILYAPSPSQYITYIDNKFSALDVLTASLNDALSKQITTPCVAMFMILGLLLASMYFAGRSPVTLLDITTPRLPAPKSFAAGGQIIAPFGYTEMKRTIKTKGVKAVAAWGAASLAYKRAVGGAASAKIANAAGSISGKGAVAGKWMGAGDLDQNKKFFETLALAATKAGYKWHDIQGLAKHIYNYSEKDHRTVQRILQRIEALGGRDKIVAASLNDYLRGTRLYQTLEVLTAHPEVGKRSKIHHAIQTNLGRFVGAHRFPTIGPLFLGGTDSLVRSGRIAKRMTVGMGRHGVQLLRETGKWAVELKPGALENLRLKAKGSKAADMFYKEITKKGPPINIGGMFPIADKMGHLYKQLHAEAHKDMMRYLMKQIYRKYGISFGITEKGMVEMSFKDMDILRASGYSKSAALNAVESQMRAILGDARLTAPQKYNQMLSLARSLGVHLDPKLALFAHSVAAIDGRNEDGHVKLVALQSLLAKENASEKAAQPYKVRDDSGWYSLIGRQSLHGSDLWEMMTLRRMIHDGEHGMLRGGIDDILKSGYLYNINRMTSLDPQATAAGGVGMHGLPEFMRNPAELQKINQRVRGYLEDLLTDEGRAKFAELTGKHGATDASVQDFMAVLFGHQDLLKKQGLTSDGSGVHVDPKSGIGMWFEEDNELGPRKDWWKVDMKRHWRDGLMESEALAIGQWVEYRFTKGYTSPYKASIESELDKYHGSKTWSPEKRSTKAREHWMIDQLREDVHNFSNSLYCQNAYGTTNETMRFYNATAAGFLLKAMRDRGMDENHKDIQFLERLDVNNPKQMKKFKAMLGTTYKEDFQHVLSQQLTYDDVAKTKQVWVMMAEGGYAPYKKGMMLGDHDRPLNGVPALQDEKGKWRRIDLDNVKIALPPALQMQFAQVSHEPKPEKWKAFLDNMKQWAKTGGFEAQKQFATVVWNYGRVTHDYGKFWDDSKIKLVNKRETTPLAPNVLRYFKDEYPTLQKILKPVRDHFMLYGDYVSRVAQDAGGSVYKGSYEVTPTSEWYKQSSFRLAHHIMSEDWNELTKDIRDPVERKRVQQHFRSLALSHGAYHQVWDFVVDRNPKRHSTSMGGVESFGAYFHFGPNRPYSIRSNLRAYLNKAEYINFNIFHGWPAKIAQYPFQPFVHMMRGVQMAMQGYPNRWSQSTDPMRYYYYTQPRLLEAFQAMNPFSFKTGSGKIGRAMDKMNMFKGSLQDRHLTGKVFERGLSQAPQDINIVKKGVYATARTGAANPGSSYYDYRHQLQVDPYMAEYLAYRTKGPAAAFYKADPYIRDQALTNTTRRTVSAEALSMRRLEEQDQHGMGMNPIFGWFSAPHFLWHLPVPGLSGISPKELLTTHMNRARRGQGGVGQALRDIGTKGLAAGGRLIRPHRMADVKWCECGTPSMGTYCKRCGSHFYR